MFKFCLIVAWSCIAFVEAATVRQIIDKSYGDINLPADCGDLLQLVEGRQKIYRNSNFFRGQKRLENVYFSSEGHPSVLEILPSHIKGLTGKRPARGSNQNCRAAAMLWFSSETPRVGMCPDTFADLLEKDFQLLDYNINAQFADVIVYSPRYAKRDIRHAAILIGKGIKDYIVWHKGSADYKDPWTFQSLDSASLLYQRPDYDIRVYRRLCACCEAGAKN